MGRKNGPPWRLPSQPSGQPHSRHGGRGFSSWRRPAATVDRDVAQSQPKSSCPTKFSFSFPSGQATRADAQMRRPQRRGGSFARRREDQDQPRAQHDDKIVKRQEAIIQSMTPARTLGGAWICSAHRARRRIAKGAGVDVAAVNRLIKQFLEMQKMMKQLQKLGKGGFMRGMMPKMFSRSMTGLGTGIPGLGIRDK